MKTEAPRDGAAASTPTHLQCGVVMPISEIDGCPESHWQDVKEILFEAIEAAEFEPNLVSDADDIGIIQKRIIHNLYENPIVVCDVSGKNPNVMFELGIRLAFDKPTIIVKDDKTEYSFDTAAIEHLEYPRDLRFSKINAFKDSLTEKIQGTHDRATKDKTYTTFLKHFGTFVVPRLDTQEVPRDAFILTELQALRKSINELTVQRKLPFPQPPSVKRNLCLRGATAEVAERVLSDLRKIPGIGDTRMIKPSNGHTHFRMLDAEPAVRQKALLMAKEIAPNARLV
jgi:hypothetical protein